jgi:hypothetical protein
MYRKKREHAAEIKRDLLMWTLLQSRMLAAAYTPISVSVPGHIWYYWTRTNCPTVYDDMIIKTTCEEDIPETITDVIPVSSHDG